ncbi:MAG TPA: hypothetical protein DEB31_08230 [Clostridiales bacterium]|nr:hypothetical protein [Clostridiales bacterium]
MTITSIKDGTVLQAVKEGTDTVHRVTFSAPYKDDSFFVKSREFYTVAEKEIGTQYRLSFYSGDSLCTFLCVIQRVFIKSGSFLTLLEQVSDIEETSQRKYLREDIAAKITLHNLSEDDYKNSRFSTGPAVFSGMSINISAGGLCIVSNEKLRPSEEPYYLAEFSLGKDTFLLPSILARRTDAPHFMGYRYSYSFEFLFDLLPAEQNRLLGVLINTKAAAFLGKR